MQYHHLVLLHTIAEILFVLGRIIFGGYFLYSGLNHLKSPGNMVGYTKSKGVPYPLAAVIGTGLLMVVGGLAVIVNYYAILGMWLLLIFMVPTTVIMHNFWKLSDPQARMMDKMAFLKNLAIIGAILIMIAI